MRNIRLIVVLLCCQTAGEQNTAKCESTETDDGLVPKGRIIMAQEAQEGS